MGKLQVFFSVSNDECTAAGGEFGILLRQKNATISARETNRTKKSMSTTAQTYWQSSAEIWEGQRNCSLKNEVDKDAKSCFSIRKDWSSRFAPNLLPYTGVRAVFFRGHVRSCEKGLRPRLHEDDVKTENDRYEIVPIRKEIFPDRHGTSLRLTSDYRN